MLIARKPQRFKRDHLDRAQQLASTGQQHRRIGAGEIHQDFRPFPIAIVGERRVHSNTVLYPQAGVCNYRSKQLIDLMSRSDFVWNSHKLKLLAVSSWLLA